MGCTVIWEETWFGYTTKLSSRTIMEPGPMNAKQPSWGLLSGRMFNYGSKLKIICTLILVNNWDLAAFLFTIWYVRWWYNEGPLLLWEQETMLPGRPTQTSWGEMSYRERCYGEKCRGEKCCGVNCLLGWNVTEPLENPLRPIRNP